MVGVEVIGMGKGHLFYARHRLDLSSGDSLFGVGSCCRPWRRDRLEAEVLGSCSSGDGGLVCYSVRSGWDLWLGARGLRGGDEVLVSAVTHPDMVRILRGHGLCAVPVDIDPHTLAPHPSALEAALTSRTRVLLVAHLFGGCMDLGPVAGFAREHGLILVEDCAQAFRGPEQVGDSAADVSMYSFGTLKTSTALGGAVLRVRDRGVLRKMRETQAGYTVQRRGAYLKRLLVALGIVTISQPRPYALLAGLCTRLGADLDGLVNVAVRAFPTREPEGAFFRRLRQRPCTPLLAVLSRRLRTFDRRRLSGRAAAGERFARRLRLDDVHPGGRALRRTHWLFPVVVQDPRSLILDLREVGLDASQATSSIVVVEADAGSLLPARARRMMSGIVFLPVYPDLPPHALDAMVDLVNRAAGKAVEQVTLS
jgi:perosamine synthetase